MIGDSADRPADLARALIAEFGSLAAVLAAGAPRLLRTTGNPAAVDRLRATRAAMRHALATHLSAGPVLTNWQAVLDYVRSEQGWLNHERLRVLYLDARSGLVADDLAVDGTLDAVHAHPRELIARALEVGAASLILVHNHPSGMLNPSRADIIKTQQMVDAGQLFDIAVVDHLIVGRTGHYSFRAHGLLPSVLK